MAQKERQISVRLPTATLHRCDTLLAALEKHPKLGALRPSRNGLINLLLITGLEALEEEYGVTPTPTE